VSGGEDIGLRAAVPGGSPRVVAVVLTHRRPRLAGDVVRSLLGDEGLAPRQVIVVVNGVGGLDDPDLESAVRTIRLPHNLGPAGGFAAGMAAAFADRSVRWAYLCEDDVGLFALPRGRLAGVVERAERAQGTPPEPADAVLGAVVAYGRRFVGRGAHTENVVPPPVDPDDLVPVDVASWGATLVSRAVFDAGIVPDPSWFFGLEDFDFFCRVGRAGFAVMVDGRSARAVADQQTSAGRQATLRGRRPTDADEVWRSYYHARNSVEFARRYGDPSWQWWNAAYAARHLQLASGWAERRAIAHGLWDGARRRRGEHPAYGRTLDEGPSAGGPPVGTEPPPG